MQEKEGKNPRERELQADWGLGRELASQLGIQRQLHAGDWRQTTSKEVGDLVRTMVEIGRNSVLQENAPQYRLEAAQEPWTSLAPVPKPQQSRQRQRQEQDFPSAGGDPGFEVARELGLTEPYARFQAGHGWRFFTPRQMFQFAEALTARMAPEEKQEQKSDG